MNDFLPLHQIWNPWHGCHKYSEGCNNCYMFKIDEKHGRDGNEIYKTKGDFNLPIKKNRYKQYKIPSGSTLRVAMTSDFFLEEADKWRDEAWNIIRQRPDINFWLLTKRASRIKDHLPTDWNDGWNNVYLNVSTENQKRADERIPYLLNIKAKHKGVMVAPFIDEVDLSSYLASGEIKEVLADGENYDGCRPLHYEWVVSLYNQCKTFKIPFSFYGTGNLFVKDGKTYHICKAYQRVEALRSHLQYPDIQGDFPIQKRCATCSYRNNCNGCSWCGKCNQQY